MKETTEEFFKALLLSQSGQTAKELGFTVGQKFIASDLRCDISGSFAVEDTLTFIRDDGSTCPLFENQDGGRRI